MVKIFQDGKWDVGGFPTKLTVLLAVSPSVGVTSFHLSLQKYEKCLQLRNALGLVLKILPDTSTPISACSYKCSSLNRHQELSRYL